MMTILLEYIDSLLQFSTNVYNIAIIINFTVPYYAGVMLNAFNDLLCSELCWYNRRVPTLDCLNFAMLHLVCGVHKTEEYSRISLTYI